MKEFRVSGKVPIGSEWAAEPSATTLERHMVACLPAVVTAEEDQIVRLVLVNPSQTKRRVPAGATVAMLSAIAEEQSTNPVTQAKGPKLTKRQKLNKVLEELQYDELKLAPGCKARLALLVEKFLDAFAEHDADVGRTSLVFHEIDVGDRRPLRQPPRRIPYGEHRDEIERQIGELE